ncbi:MAG: GTP-binding protein [Hyphomicrobiaceae bacterium]|nr:GTP-binding protein [Hyphomicrobiaceae bacterium]
MTLPKPPVPVTVIGGYLGAGKTTLVNNLLRAANGLRLAVLVNEFGTLPIDADLIEARDEEMIAITGGCICCSYGSDLVAALISMARREPGPDQILVETSGVALPGAVASALTLVAGLALDAVVVLADSETVRERAEDRYTGDTIKRQLVDADIILLNKTDLLDPAAREGVRGWLQSTAPRARIVTTLHARVPRALLIAGEGRPPATATGSDRDMSVLEPHGHAHHWDAGGHDSASFTVSHPVDPERLASILAHDVPALVRAKGFLPGADGQLYTLQLVGRRWTIARAPEMTAGAGRIVAISAGEPLDVAAVEAALAAARS